MQKKGARKNVYEKVWPVDKDDDIIQRLFFDDGDNPGIILPSPFLSFPRLSSRERKFFCLFLRELAKQLNFSHPLSFFPQQFFPCPEAGQSNQLIIC